MLKGTCTKLMLIFPAACADSSFHSLAARLSMFPLWLSSPASSCLPVTRGFGPPVSSVSCLMFLLWLYFPVWTVSSQLFTCPSEPVLCSHWNSWNSALKCLKKMTRSLLYSLFSCALTLSQMFPMIPENSTSLLKGNGAIHLRPGYQHLQTRQFNMNKTLKITSSVNICVGVTSDSWVICI